MASPSRETAIVTAMKTAVVRKLDLDPSQAEVALAPYFDPTWVNYPHFLVIPGESAPDGGGSGAQDGGALLRKMLVTVKVYVRMNVDPHGESEQLLTQADGGTLDLFEALRQVFAYTFLGTAGDLDSFLLYQPLQVAGESATAWVEEGEELGIVARDFRWNAWYGLPLPDQTTLSLSDVL